VSNGLLRSGALNYGTICPRCAGPKAEQALRCQSCRTEELRGEEFYAKRTCSDCGGLKWHGSIRCHGCESELRRGVSIPGRPNPPDHPWRKSLSLLSEVGQA
jgi:hypothetical protein